MTPRFWRDTKLEVVIHLEDVDLDELFTGFSQYRAQAAKKPRLC
jgi:hypothetical protein